MSAERIDELLQQWEQCKRTLSAEELCQSCPELIPELTKWINALHDIEQSEPAITGRHGTTQVLQPERGSPLPDPGETRPVAQGMEGPTQRPQPGSKPSSPQHDSRAAQDCPHRFGDYELISEIGRGGMGVVYKARHLHLNRVVALKMLLHDSRDDSDDVLRFQREMRAIAHLAHPGIVPIHDAGAYDGRLFYSMAFVDGENLAQRVLREGPLTEWEAARLLLSVAEAIAFAHQRGIIHRDLKPANVLVTKEGQPIVTDFGLAKRIAKEGSQTVTSIMGSIGNNAITLEGQVIGTPCYMSREQALGKIAMVGAATDTYALGCILYVMLVGCPPFVDHDKLKLMLMVIEQDPTPPRQVKPSLSPEIEAICLKCLQKNPCDRYPTAAELVDDLRRYLSHSAATETQPSPPRFGDFELIREIRREGDSVICEARELSTNSLITVRICRQDDVPT